MQSNKSLGLLVLALTISLTLQNPCDNNVHSTICNLNNGTTACCPVKEASCCASGDFCCPKGLL